MIGLRLHTINFIPGVNQTRLLPKRTSLSSMSPGNTWPPIEFVASPIAYNGVVYIATLGGTVTALDAATGKAKWSHAFGQEIRATPVYDKGLIFIGIHAFGPQSPNGEFPPVPSSFYALDATTGAVKWQRALQGNIRSSPAIVGGNVYVPVAGGDPPACLQGGIAAFNESSGAPLWNFYVNPAPAQGGSVWSPIGYDGTHLIFGTGNTCIPSVLAANAIVALNPSTGAVAWQLNTAAPASDDDVGAGVLLVHGMAVSVGKNGNVYYLDAATGAELSMVHLNTVDGGGGFSTPASDGGTIVLGTGAVSASSSSRHTIPSYVFAGRIRPEGAAVGGRLMAFDLAGKREVDHYDARPRKFHCRYCEQHCVRNG